MVPLRTGVLWEGKGGRGVGEQQQGRNAVSALPGRVEGLLQKSKEGGWGKCALVCAGNLGATAW